MKSCNNWILFASSLALSLIFAEALVRFFRGDDIVLFPRYQAAVTYGEFTIRRLRPETTFWHTSVDGSWRFVVNKQGFRDHRDFPYNRDDDILRIIVLGDSHTQGFEVRQDHTYAAVIERYLGSQSWQSEVINAGLSGVGTAEEAVLLEYEGLKYNPDVVVLGFYANDFEDNIKSDLFRLENDELTVNKTSHAPGTAVLKVHNAIAPLRWLSENSYLYSLAMNAIWELAKTAFLARKREELEMAVATREADNYEKQLVARLVKRMYRLCKERDIMFVIVDIPKAGERGEFRSSIPDGLLDEFERNSDALVRSEKVLSRYRNVAEFHLPHGQHHISEFSHMILGVEVAQEIQNLLVPGISAKGGTTAFRSAEDVTSRDLR
jgi:hypothetical protein